MYHSQCIFSAANRQKFLKILQNIEKSAFDMFHKNPVLIDAIKSIKSTMCCSTLNCPLIRRPFRSKATYRLLPSCLAGICDRGKVNFTELYYISGDCALIPRQSTNCNQKHGGFWPNLRHFDVTVSLFSCRTPLTRYLSGKNIDIIGPIISMGKNLSMSRGQWMAP